MKNLVDASWAKIVEPLLRTPGMQALSHFLEEERATSTVFPSQDLVFNALRLTSFDNLKVVILGQDPYHNVGQAHGLSFSVPPNIDIPPSLKNIFKELADDIDGFVIPQSGDLTAWASQGVLLLNSVLTVRAHEASSHQKKGWEEFTDAIISHISQHTEDVVFILWGSFAHKKAKMIDEGKHMIIKSVHPSPLSVYRGFYGSKPFSKANNYLQSKNKDTINWHLI